MKKVSFIIFFFATFLVASAQNLSLGDITQGKYRPKTGKSLVSSSDGIHYYQTDNKKTMIIKYAYKTGSAVDTIFSVNKARECKISSFDGFLISPDEKRLLVYDQKESIYRRSFKAVYYYYDVRRNLIRPLTENKSKQSVPVFSRDGRMLAYVSDNNLWLSKFDYDTESQITKDGQFGRIINGATDWVYEEEFGTTNLIDFSADSKLLGFVSFDESAVKEFSFQTYGSLYPELLSVKYPKAGEKNSKVVCNVFDIDSKTIRQMNIPTQQTEYIPRIEFIPSDPNQLAVMTLNREQNEFNMYYANARSTVSRLILHEKNERYVDPDLLNSIRFMGSEFVCLSERSGYSHIYLYNSSGVLQRTLTNGNYDVTAILGVDPETKSVYYSSAQDSPLERSIYKVETVKGVATKLSSRVGYNSASFSANAKYYINTWSDSNTPAVVSLNDDKGKEIRILEDNSQLKASLGGIPKKEFVKVKTASDELNAWIIKPSNFDASKKYPLVMVQYSGPNSQEVLNQFEIDWVHYLANQGFVVACVDGRGTGARGEDFRKCTYMNLGIKESDDQIASAKYFGSLPYVDMYRIGIWGWSYGGYTTLMSMSRGSGIFKAGVAIAPVTDWKFYDSVYTERFMRTPQQNMQGYEKGSPISYVGDLQGRLLLVHGSADDNVHFQNSLKYSQALIGANKQFDMFVFTDENHSIPGAKNREYLYTKVIEFFKSHL